MSTLTKAQRRKLDRYNDLVKLAGPEHYLTIEAAAELVQATDKGGPEGEIDVEAIFATAGLAAIGTPISVTVAAKAANPRAFAESYKAAIDAEESERKAQITAVAKGILGIAAAIATAA